jgi:hypothetical protein
MEELGVFKHDPSMARASGTNAAAANTEGEKAELFEQIGRLNMESARSMVEMDHSPLTLRRRCELLGLSRSRARSRRAIG